MWPIKTMFLEEFMQEPFSFQHHNHLVTKDNCKFQMKTYQEARKAIGVDQGHIMCIERHATDLFYILFCLPVPE